MKVTAIYFSPTGGSKKSAGSLAAALSGGSHAEIDLTPGLNVVSTRLQLGGVFQNMYTAQDETPYMQSQGKGGKVGAEEATGYTIEAFFPY